MLAVCEQTYKSWYVSRFVEKPSVLLQPINLQRKSMQTRGRTYQTLNRGPVRGIHHITQFNMSRKFQKSFLLLPSVSFILLSPCSQFLSPSSLFWPQCDLFLEHLTLLPHLWGCGVLQSTMQWLSTDCCGPLDSFHLILTTKLSGNEVGGRWNSLKKEATLSPFDGLGLFSAALFKHIWSSLCTTLSILYLYTYILLCG